MIVFIGVLLIPSLAILGRAHGAGLTDGNGAATGFPTWGRLASSIAFPVAFGAANFALFTLWWLALLSAGVTFFGIATGHGRFYAMKGANPRDPNPEQIEKWFVLPWYPGDITKPLYSWVCMGIKGLLIGLAAAPFGFMLAVLWPLAYYISFKFWKDSAPAEWLSGAFAGLIIFCAMLAT